ncbi:MAG: glucuronate isomerase [Calditrichaeota bacterium]|nr:MAG: glucuronate isomerase [Calditrichota bacterium]
MSDLLKPHEDRFFDPDPTVRRFARDLYNKVKNWPIISPHGHTEPSWFSENKPFSDPTALILIPDHYIFRMLFSQGISMESLGVPTIDGGVVEQDHRKIWQLFADHFYLFAGTPTAAWLSHEFYEVFGIAEKLTSKSAMAIYEHIDSQLKKPEFLPRAILERFKIELLSTTDPAESELEHHKTMRDSDWSGRIIPAFRPDGVTDISRPDWQNNLAKLAATTGMEIDSFDRFIQALEQQRHFFKTMGATSTDHGVLTPYTCELSRNEAENIFQKACAGTADKTDALKFTAHMLMEMARMSVDDGLVMQIHAGSFRNHNQAVFKRFGADKGADIPQKTEYTKNLHALLNKFGNNINFNLILFTLDESTYSRELAPLAGHYPAVKLGPPWWFHDSIEGMKRCRERTIETAGFYNTAGFNDDTRALLSIPARHDLARRVDCNFLAGLVARHQIGFEEAEELIGELTHGLVKKAYKLEKF